MEMLNGPSHIATRVKYFSYHDFHGRQIKLRTIETEQEYSRSYCSYVSASIDNVLKIGRILTLFNHTFLSKTTTFAYVSWFEDVFEGVEANLTYVITSSQTQSTVPVNMLSKPLVVAFDGVEQNKLWILNLHNHGSN